MSKNSIIDNEEDKQLSREIELSKTLDKNHGYRYFYENYFLINGEHPKFSDADKNYLDTLLKVIEEDKKGIIIINKRYRPND